MSDRVVWVLVNCKSIAEARAIGDAALRARAASCSDVFRRELTRYFWPPQAGEIAAGKGALLVLETFDGKFPAVERLVRRLHSDRLPFVGAVRIDHVSAAYRRWMRGELAPQRGFHPRAGRKSDRGAVRRR